MIKILAIADLHWFTSEELSKIKDAEYDICVLLGDIPIDAIRSIKNLNGEKPIIGIAGNHDGWNSPELGGIENIHCKAVEYCGYTFAGLSGSSRYKSGNYPMLDQKESIELCRKIPKSDIFISHDCMYHLIGKDKPHSGLLGIDLYHLRNRTKLNLCGHHHVRIIQKRLWTTTICVFRCAVITYPNMEIEYVF